MKTENELIAEFMGIQVYQSYEAMQAVPLEELKEWRTPDQLAYDLSWNELMPVVEKIENTKHPEIKGRDFVVTIDSCITIISENGENPVIEEQGYETRIENAYHAVVKFIKWYQEHGK